MLFTLALSLVLKTRQVDCSNAFVQAYIDEEVYCDLLLEVFGPSLEAYILKLKKSLYGLKQAPRQWFKKQETVTKCGASSAEKTEAINQCPGWIAFAMRGSHARGLLG